MRSCGRTSDRINRLTVYLLSLTEIGVSVYAVNPGVVKTDVLRHMKKSVQFFVKTFGLLIKTPAEGAYTTLYCALTPGLPSGAYYRFVRCDTGAIIPLNTKGNALRYWYVH